MVLLVLTLRSAGELYDLYNMCTGIMQAEKELLELWENKNMWWSSLHSSIVIYAGLVNSWPVFLKSMYCTDFRMELGNTSWLRQGWQCELPQDARKQSRLKVLHVGIDRCRCFGCVSTADCRATIVYFTSCVQQGWSYDVYHSGSTHTARGRNVLPRPQCLLSLWSA